MREKRCSMVFCANNTKNVKTLLQIVCILMTLLSTQAAEMCLAKECTSSSDTQTSRWLGRTSSFNDPEDSANAIMDFIEDQVDVLPFAKYREVVFVMGGENTDKTTLVLFLTDGDLEAVETAPDSGKYVYIDKDGPLNEYPPKIDSNLIPGLIPNRDSGIEYYILPQINVTAGVKQDITAVHLRQRLLKFARGVKFLFTLSYDCVKNGKDNYEKREELRELARSATELIIDLDKYNNSIALVITGTEVGPDSTDDRERVSAQEVIQQTMRDFLDMKKGTNFTAEKEEEFNKNIRFLQILEKQTPYGEYLRMGIFRAANQAGLISDMELVQDGKYFIRNILRENLIYTSNENTDFHYSITRDSRDRIQEMLEVTELRISDDILNINQNLQNIHVKFEEDLSEIKVLYEKMNIGFEAISQIDATEPKMFVKQVLAAAETLAIEIPTKSIDTILKHIEFMDFAQDLEEISPSNAFKMTVGVQDTAKYLKDSKDWYSYLLELHDILSEYKVQKNVMEYNDDVALIMERTKIGRNEYRNVTDIGLKELLKNIGNSLPPLIESLTVNFFKLQKLASTLHRTMIDQATKYCSPGKIVVKGYNVKVSSYKEMECTGDLKFIEIFAANNLFIDADVDKRGEQVQIFFIAPFWEIIGNRKFILNGVDAEPIQPSFADDGNKTSIDGKIGIPGKAGGSAGCFLAIGHKFINDKNLEIFLNGGRGGDAQHGGKGFDAIKGKDPPMPIWSFQVAPTWSKRKFDFDKIFEITIPTIWGFAAILYMFEVQGKPYKPPGAGGDGGRGGIGGIEGQTFLVGTERDPEFRITNIRGENGTDGEGGVGGKGNRDGNDLLMVYRDAFFVTMIFVPGFICVYRKNGKWHPNGKDGINGKNDEDIELPNPVRFIDPAYTINNYKSYLRENMANNIQETRLMEFMLDLEMDKRVQSLYDTMGLFDDLRCLENQYLQLRNSLSFIPFHESLLNRTDEYANSNQIWDDHRKVLRFIYTAAAGKISNMRHFRQHVLITDLQEYLQIVEKSINKLREVQKEVSVSEQKKQYEKMLNEKISSALDLVNKEVIPELLNIFKDLGEEIPKLVEEVSSQAGDSFQVAPYGKGLNKALQKLQDAIRKFKVAAVLRLVARFASFFGKTGDKISQYLQKAASALDAFTSIDIEALLEGLKNTMANVVQFLKEDFLVYLDQLDHIIWLIKDFPNCYDDVRKFIEKAKKDIWKLFESTKPYEFLEGLIEEKRKELKDLLEAAEKNCPLLESPKSFYSIKKRAAKETNEIEDVDKESFKEMKGDEKKVITYAEAERKSKDEMENWQKRLRTIKKKLIPMFAQMQATIINMTSSLENKTAVELDITAWKIQSVVGDVKSLFSQMAAGTSLEQTLTRHVEKIGETFACIIKIYDRIQSYQDQAKFAEYLANIQSPASLDIADKNLRDVVLQVKLVIQTNIVMDQYQIAIHSFKQHQFPFAHIHLATFDLPTGLEANDTKTIVSRAVEEVSYLQELTKFLAISIGKFDRDVFGNIDFDSNDGSIAVPFYTFRSREYKHEVKRLLKGEEVMINADIRYAFNQNAVKFNKIGIHFKMVNGMADAQSELNTVLENFGVRMTMIGHNYYQCGGKFYYLSVDDSLVIEYSFKRNPDGKPVKYNEVYRKLDGKNYFLSPYAIWQVQLVKIMDDFPSNKSSDTRIGFSALNKFERESINVELFGRGQYLRANGEIAKEVCTDEIKKYYFSDDFTKEIDDMAAIKRVYLL